MLNIVILCRIRPQQKVRPQRRKVVSTANPLRSLAARSNVNSILYEETKTGVAEKELNRIKREQGMLFHRK